MEMSNLTKAYNLMDLTAFTFSTDMLGQHDYSMKTIAIR